MKKIAFASGKGGAGKTSLSLSYHKYLKDNSVFADCDVDAADAFLLIEDKIIKKEKFHSGYNYRINSNLCTNCGACVSGCNYDAIKLNQNYYIDSLKCEGCGACEDRCKNSAIERTDKLCGSIFHSATLFNSEMIYARLIPGEDNSGKLVFQVRSEAKELTEKLNKDYLIIDCPPGIGCALMASITTVEMLVIVVECSLSGFGDAKRLIEIAEKMNIPYVVILNKSGINPDLDKEITVYFKENNILVIGDIPFNEEFVNILNKKQLLIDSKEVSNSLTDIYSKIIPQLSKGDTK